MITGLDNPVYFVISLIKILYQSKLKTALLHIVGPFRTFSVNISGRSEEDLPKIDYFVYTGGRQSDADVINLSLTLGLRWPSGKIMITCLSPLRSRIRFSVRNSRSQSSREEYSQQQYKTKRDETKQDETKQDETKQNKTKQNKTKQNKTKAKRDETKQDETKQNKTKYKNKCI